MSLLLSLLLLSFSPQSEAYAADVTATGSCPGLVEFSASNATANAPVSLLQGGVGGSDIISVGPCSVTTSLSAPNNTGVQTTDASGVALFSSPVGPARCGDGWQVLDIATCTLSGAFDFASQDADGDGIFASDDCDDTDPLVGSEVTIYRDVDGDGYGNDAVAFFSCVLPAGASLIGGDCMDTNAAVNPGATEVANGLDDDCDGTVNEGTHIYDDDGDGLTEADGDCDDADASVLAATPKYYDNDGDGYGDPAAYLSICATPPWSVDNGNDCDDTDSSINPGAFDIIADGIDQDCDGADAVLGPVCEGSFTVTSVSTMEEISACESISGDLTIASSTLTNLDGLSSLGSVGYRLFIEDNPALTNIDGLSNIGSIASDFWLTNNISLSNLDGLWNLSAVGGRLFIQDNPVLTNVDGLSSLTSVGGDFWLTGNNALTNIAGLSILLFIDGRLFIEDNMSLCVSYVNTFVAEIMALGWSDSVYSSGNDDSC